MNSNKKNASSATIERCGSQVSSMSPTSLAARFLQVYSTRSALMGADLFQAPAWEILLHLATADDGLSHSALMNTIEIPQTTLDRWLGVLQGRGLIGDSEPYRLTTSARSDLNRVLRSALEEPAEAEA